MPSGTPCPCLLCSTEACLLRTLNSAEKETVDRLFSPSPRLRRFSSISSLIRYLRNSPCNSEVDEILGELCALRKAHAGTVENLLVLIFLPMLHATIRQITDAQALLPGEDVTQQVLTSLLQCLSSKDLETRRSHFAFAISRTVKRRTFDLLSAVRLNKLNQPHVALRCIGTTA